MATDAPGRHIKEALARWQHAAEAAILAGCAADAPFESDDIPDHVRAYLEQALSQASSPYWVGECFAQARELVRYPPGFVAPHPAYLAYRGDGIAAVEHVQGHLFDFACPNCGSAEDVVVRSSEWGVNLTSGDARGQFCAECGRCGRSFSGSFED
ncbi:MAG: hypothetical protein KDI37_00390 [Xanthomonadales bacterium]|nr:hypothetical protein [Xanthomonadales bacterium]MCB1640162.1 hypothetical protein [Xanthomonadales bacterium]